jgi:hypothetical protein
MKSNHKLTTKTSSFRDLTIEEKQSISREEVNLSYNIFKDLEGPLSGIVRSVMTPEFIEYEAQIAYETHLREKNLAIELAASKRYIEDTSYIIAASASLLSPIKIVDAGSFSLNPRTLREALIYAPKKSCPGMPQAAYIETILPSLSAMTLQRIKQKYQPKILHPEQLQLNWTISNTPL